jgi:hypothetical protein
MVGVRDASTTADTRGPPDRPLPGLARAIDRQHRNSGASCGGLQGFEPLDHQLLGDDYLPTQPEEGRRRPPFVWYARHGRQLGGASPPWIR